MKRGAPLMDRDRVIPVAADVEGGIHDDYDKTHKGGHSTNGSGSGGFGMATMNMGMGGGGSSSYTSNYSYAPTNANTNVNVQSGSAPNSYGSNNTGSSSVGVSSAYGYGGYGGGGIGIGIGGVPPTSSSSSSLNRMVFGLLSKTSTDQLKLGLIIALAAPIVLSLVLPLTLRILAFIASAIAFGIIGSIYLAKTVLENDDGTEAMRAVSDPIRQGAEGFLNVQYSAIATFALPLSVLLIISYQFRPNTDGHVHAGGNDVHGGVGIHAVSNMTLGIVSALGFLFGAVCSAISGYTSMWVAAQTNIRVASAGRRSYTEALVICFRGGAFSALLNLTLCVAGVTALYVILYQVFCLMGSAGSDAISPVDLPILMVGYGFGASFVALFMQLGGGIYTKAADVGADLVGKVENNVPEDDPRNPAVIADLVGDMVGDCVGSSADVFESVAAEIIGAMILASTLANEASLEDWQAIKFLFFPLVVHAMDIVVSSMGIAMVNTSGKADSNPMKQLQKGYRVAMIGAVVGFYLITWWLLNVKDINGDSGSSSSFNFFLCGIVGMAWYVKFDFMYDTYTSTNLIDILIDS